MSTRSNADRPDILLFLPDQCRYDSWGYNRELPLRTPHLDRLATEPEAVRRRQAWRDAELKRAP